MCEPTSIAIGSMAMTAASTAVRSQQQSSAADAAEEHGMAQYEQDLAYYNQTQKYQLERYIENADRAHAEVRRNYSEIDQRIGQDAQAAALEIHKFMAQSRALQATGTATDAERGVSGPTADYILDNIHRHTLRNVENIRREQKWRLDAMMGMKDEVEAQGLARVESMNPQPIPLPNLPSPVQRPSPFAAILDFGASALNTYSNFMQNQPKLPSGTMGSGAASGGSAAGSSWLGQSYGSWSGPTTASPIWDGGVNF